MTRVRKERAASVATGATRHKQADQNKSSYKVIFEEFIKKKELKKYLTNRTSPPKGYTFIPAGDPQLTQRCKRASKELETPIFIVSAGGMRSMELSKEVHRIGYHFSTFAVDKACQGLGVTLNAAGRVAQSNLSYLNDDFTNSMGKRHATHMSKANPRISRDQNQVEDTLSQEVIDSQARQAIRDLFPKIPERDLEEIILRAFDKQAGLVGTAQGFSLPRRVNLAVGAHIRHTYTNYDDLLKTGTTWIEARRGVEHFTLDKLVSWRGEEDDDNDPIMEEVLREVVVISDDEHESDEEIGLTEASRRSPAHQLPPEDLQSAAIDLTMSDADDSEDDLGPYQANVHLRQSRAASNAAQRAREGQQLHARWEQALNRQRRNPLPADTRKGEKPPSHTLVRTTDQQITGKQLTTPGFNSYGSPTSRPQHPPKHSDRSSESYRTRHEGLPAVVQNQHLNAETHDQMPQQHQVDILRSRSVPNETNETSSTELPVFPVRQVAARFPQDNVLPSIEIDQLLKRPHFLTVQQQSASCGRGAGEHEIPSAHDRKKLRFGNPFDRPPLESHPQLLPGLRPGTVLIPLDNQQDQKSLTCEPSMRTTDATDRDKYITVPHPENTALQRPKAIVLRQSTTDSPVHAEGGGSSTTSVYTVCRPPLHQADHARSEHHVPSSEALTVQSKPRLIRLSADEVPHHYSWEGHSASQFQNAQPGRILSTPAHDHALGPRTRQPNPLARADSRIVVLDESPQATKKLDLDGMTTSPMQAYSPTKQANPMQRPPRLIRLGPGEGSESGYAEHSKLTLSATGNPRVSPRCEVMLPPSNVVDPRSSKQFASNIFLRPATKYEAASSHSRNIYNDRPGIASSYDPRKQPAPVQRFRDVVMLDD